jgi:hypothetical protein
LYLVGAGRPPRTGGVRTERAGLPWCRERETYRSIVSFSGHVETKVAVCCCQNEDLSPVVSREPHERGRGERHKNSVPEELACQVNSEENQH